MHKYLKTIAAAALLIIPATLVGCKGGSNNKSEASDTAAAALSQTSESQSFQILSSNPLLEAPDGSQVRLADILDAPTYIDIWATWCGPCRGEIPYFKELYTEMKDSGVKFISISCDENKDAWQSFVEKENPEWPQYILADDSGADFMGEMDIQSIPRFIILGEGGKIIDWDAPRPSSPNAKLELETLK